jgi:uncharacterized membrane protein
VSGDDEAAGTSTRRLRGQGKGRLEAFSDGVFAIAITLLVLDLAIPDSSLSRADLLTAVVDEWPGYLGYLVSFGTIGALWLGHNAITGYIDHANQGFLRLNLIFLLFVCLLPFVTRLLSEFIDVVGAERVASTVYGISLTICATLLWLLWRYALRAGLVVPDTTDSEIALLTDRVTPSLGGYVALILLGLWFPVAAVFGYLAVAVFLIIPFRIRRDIRHPSVDRRRRGRG